MNPPNEGTRTRWRITSSRAARAAALWRAPTVMIGMPIRMNNDSLYAASAVSALFRISSTFDLNCMWSSRYLTAATAVTATVATTRVRVGMVEERAGMVSACSLSIRPAGRVAATLPRAPAPRRIIVDATVGPFPVRERERVAGCDTHTHTRT